jgi:hypothetical protein
VKPCPLCLWIAIDTDGDRMEREGSSTRSAVAAHPASFKAVLKYCSQTLSRAMTDCRQLGFLFLLRLVYERTAISANDPDRSTYIESSIGVYIDERKTILMSVN